MLPFDDESFPLTLPPNRRPVRTRAPGPLGATPCNRHSNYGTYEMEGEKICVIIPYESECGSLDNTLGENCPGIWDRSAVKGHSSLESGILNMFI